MSDIPMDTKSALRRGKPFYGPHAPNWGFAWTIKATISRLALWVFRVRVQGIENLPTEGAAVLCANHIALMDSVLLWCVRLHKQPHFIAKSELYTVSGTKGRLLAWFIDMVGGMPVQRGTADRTMIANATDLLNAGEWLAIFPEGTRNKGADKEALGEAMGGAAYLAMRADAPLIPVGIDGTDRIFVKGAKLPRFPRITFAFGEPILPADFEGRRKQRMEAITAQVMASIREMRKRARSR
jgi:1-acyl-sn-glycerol-3-phosphate acyltransferase